MSNSKKYSWHKIALSQQELQFNNEGLLQLNAADKSICLIQKNNRLTACAAKCPHAGGTLAAGFTDAAENIVCPLHRYRFSIHNGRNTSGEGYFLKTYPVEIRDDGIFIRLEEKGSLFSW